MELESESLFNIKLCWTRCICC